MDWRKQIDRSLLAARSDNFTLDDDYPQVNRRMRAAQGTIWSRAADWEDDSGCAAGESDAALQSSSSESDLAATAAAPQILYRQQTRRAADPTSQGGADAASAEVDQPADPANQLAFPASDNTTQVLAGPPPDPEPSLRMESGMMVPP